MGRPTILKVDLGALRHNLDVVFSKVGRGVRVMPVVKANAYGLGASTLAPRLEQWGAGGFCVVTVDEGVKLRQAGIAGPILLLGGLWDGEGPLVRDFRLTPAVYSPESIERAAGEARAAGATFDVHLKIETGMNRLGVRPEQVDEASKLLTASGVLNPIGVFSHIADADVEFAERTLRQIERFEQALTALAGAGIHPQSVHMLASGGILASRDGQGLFTGCRPGIMLYGSTPDEALREAAGLRPVATLATRIMQLRLLGPGERVSYSGTFVVEKETLTAVLPCGYEDGIPRSLSNRGEVLVRGLRAPILGRVCMDMTIVDVTDIPDVAVGDEVVFFGTQGSAEIHIDEIAGTAGTIAYEILTSVGNRVPRVYGTDVSHEGA